jgi:hypothetical protein
MSQVNAATLPSFRTGEYDGPLHNPVPDSA